MSFQTKLEKKRKKRGKFEFLGYNPSYLPAQHLSTTTYPPLLFVGVEQFRISYLYFELALLQQNKYSTNFTILSQLKLFRNII